MTAPHPPAPRVPLMTSQQLAELLQISTETLDKWRRTGRGPRFVKAGGLIRYTPRAVTDWIAAQTIDPAPR